VDQGTTEREQCSSTAAEVIRDRFFGSASIAAIPFAAF
jgi:hypothetical protein